MESQVETGYMNQRPVLDHGFVAFDADMATDLAVVNAARVSMNKKHDIVTKADEGLIFSLMKKKHGTPFEHNAFRFIVQAPIFVFREWHRHRIGHSYNEWSARYSKLDPLFYIPTNIRVQVGKAMEYRYEPASDAIAAMFTDDLVEHSERCYRLYEKHLANGIAKEQARLFITVGVYSKMYWTVNARSMMAWLTLRNADSAQWEIHEYAKVVEQFFQETMPLTHAAYVANGRIAP